ncbi:MAG: nitrile hydratase subunit alpha [Deltaproteobacteria bacterium]|nr:nitrile hydratase subunit alpha [Deltaproteobacteria bacterium]
MSEEHVDHGHHDGAPASTQQRRLTPAENKLREIRTKAIEALLLEKTLVTSEQLDAILTAYEKDIGPLNGAKVVARAWVDPAYKERLLKDGTAAIAELGFGGLQGERLLVMENTSQVHNVIVCVLCSCYPWPVLGLPPFWYKSPGYRSRIGGNTRAVLREFGLELDTDTDIFVWNSSAQTRYMVLPERPSGTEHLHEEELAGLVTRDSMIGVAQVQRDRRTVPTGSPSQRAVADMPGETALPRQSGELVFQDPWEGEVFAMAVALCEQGLYLWSDFQTQLIAAIAAAERLPLPLEQHPTYYENWLAAFEALLIEKGLLAKAKIDTKASWLARAASSSASRSFMHLRWHMTEDEDD